MSTLILLYNEKASSRKGMGKFLGLSDLELEKYAGLQQQGGYRAVLTKAMNAAHVWRVAVSAWAHALLTAQPDERDRITQRMEAQGDAVRGIRAWVQSQHGATAV